jgi:hypothetical protein
MKRHTASIEIGRPPSETFAFLIDPERTPQWLVGVIKQECSAWPIRPGTSYRNTSASDEVEGRVEQQMFRVVGFEPERVFELKEIDGPYHVHFDVIRLAADRTRLTCVEWVDAGELVGRVTEAALDRLKSALEGSLADDANRRPRLMVELTRFTVQPGKSELVDEWMKMIRDNATTPENLTVLDHERMFVEAIFRGFEGGNEYLYWFNLQGEGPSSLHRSEYEVDQKHLRYAEECTIEGSRVDLRLEALMLPERIRKVLG